MSPLDTMASGKVTFPLETPYKLMSNGSSEAKPLLIYLHGFNQQLGDMEGAMEPLLAADAYHLFLEAPYPIFTRRKPLPKWGKSWYGYDGDQQRFKRTLEQASEFIQSTIDRFSKQLEINRIGVVGYSMGAYVGGYFALSRYRHVTDLVLYGGRLKSEWFTDQEIDYSHLGVLAVHGTHDESVKADPQKASVQEIEKEGAEVQFIEIDAKHQLTEEYARKTVPWLSDRGYLFEK
jgi:predicted esterase